MAVLAASLYCFNAMYNLNRYLASYKIVNKTNGIKHITLFIHLEMRLSDSYKLWYITVCSYKKYFKIKKQLLQNCLEYFLWTVYIYEKYNICILSTFYHFIILSFIAKKLCVLSKAFKQLIDTKLFYW